MKKSLLCVIFLSLLIGIIMVPEILHAKKSKDNFFERALQKDVKKKKKLTEEEIDNFKREIKILIKQKQFNTALEKFSDIPTKDLTKQEKQTKHYLLFFKTIDVEIEEDGSVFGSDEDLDDFTKQTIKRLYREAQYAYMQGKDAIVKDLLIHILFLHRQNTKAKKFLQNGYDLKVGSYKVENIEEKYWKEVDTYFYGGNYTEAVEAANILTFFDRENPMIYQKMGSAYYMMAQRSKAIESWKTSLFLKGGKDSILEKYIRDTKKLIEEDQTKAKKRIESRKKREAAVVAVQGELKLMGVFPTQQKAYNFAADLKKQGTKAIVEELDNGKFAVKVPKKNK